MNNVEKSLIEDFNNDRLICRPCQVHEIITQILESVYKESMFFIYREKECKDNILLNNYPESIDPSVYIGLYGNLHFSFIEVVEVSRNSNNKYFHKVIFSHNFMRKSGYIKIYTNIFRPF